MDRLDVFVQRSVKGRYIYERGPYAWPVLNLSLSSTKVEKERLKDPRIYPGLVSGTRNLSMDH